MIALTALRLQINKDVRTLSRTQGGNTDEFISFTRFQL